MNGWFWTGLAIMFSAPAANLLSLVGLHFYLRWKYLHLMVRIFQEKPLFIIPRGQPQANAEDVPFPDHRRPDAARLLSQDVCPGDGVILFGLEFGSNRWSCVPYCEHLVEAGFDVFAFEPRNQGDSTMPTGL